MPETDVCDYLSLYIMPQGCKYAINICFGVQCTQTCLLWTICRESPKACKIMAFRAPLDRRFGQVFAEHFECSSGVARKG